MTEEIEVVVTIPEPTELEPPTIVEPVVIEAVTPPEVLEELAALREFKREVDEARILEAEITAAAALATAELALEIAATPEPEIIVEQVDDEFDDVAPVEVEPDNGPSNSHSWFRDWFGK